MDDSRLSMRLNAHPVACQLCPGLKVGAPTSLFDIIGCVCSSYLMGPILISWHDLYGLLRALVARYRNHLGKIHDSGILAKQIPGSISRGGWITRVYYDAATHGPRPQTSGS